MNITKIAHVIRSKNAGPGILTFDLIFPDRGSYQRVVSSNQISAAKICELYSISPEDVINIINYDQGNAIKISIKRPMLSGNVGDTDVYGCQQVAPLYTIEIP